MVQKPKEFIQDGHLVWLCGRVPFQSFGGLSALVNLFQNKLLISLNRVMGRVG
jgi:hypothetical protein